MLHRARMPNRAVHNRRIHDRSGLALPRRKRLERFAHHPSRDMLRHLGPPGRRFIPLHRHPPGLRLCQKPPRTLRVPHQPQSLRPATHGPGKIPPPLPRKPQTLRRPRLRQHDLRRQPSLGSIHRPQRRRPRNSRPIPPPPIHPRHLRQRQRTAKHPNDLVKNVPRQPQPPIRPSFSPCIPYVCHTIQIQHTY